MRLSPQARRILLASALLGSLTSCSAGSTPAATPQCPTNPLLGVYDPSRLEVRQQCVWYRGTVTDVEPRSDGDLHVDVAPADGYGDFLDSGNDKDQDGALVVEIMPGQELPDPTVGQQVGVFGTWVHDTHNDWNEIHPVWSIQYGGDTTVTSLPPAKPEYQGDSND